MQLDAALPRRLEVVGVDLDLVGQRGLRCGGSRGEQEREREPQCAQRPSSSLKVVPLTRRMRPSFVSSTASPTQKAPLSTSTVW
jgi:hypothetical protein